MGGWDESKKQLTESLRLRAFSSMKPNEPMRQALSWQSPAESCSSKVRLAQSNRLRRRNEIEISASIRRTGFNDTADTCVQKLAKLAKLEGLDIL